MPDVFDYIIVGAGSAGSVLANRLSAGDATVCLLEAGPPDRNPFIHIPAGFMKTLRDPRVNWLYETEPGEGTAGRRIHAPRGRTLGGSSAINGHVYNRGQRMDFDGWAQAGNRGWGYADVLPYFRRGERRIGAGDDRYRGRDGELTVTDIDGREPLCDAFIEGAVAMGIPRTEDYNGAVQAGVGYFQRTIHRGRRASAAVSFLRPVRDRRNLDIRTEAHAQRIVFDGRRAVGVRYRRGGREVEVRVRREVIVAAGVIASPQLLQVSGVGPAGLLRDLGVPVVHDLPAVGENLADHFGVRIATRVRGTRTINERSRGVPLALEVLNFALRRRGILALSPSLAFAFWKSHEALEHPDLQIIFTPASYKEGVPTQLDDFPGMTIASWPMRPLSTGHVRARGADMAVKPLIQPNYLAHDEDRRILLAGIRLMRRLVRSPQLARWYDREELPGEAVQGDDELIDFARRYGTTMFHLMGTCRMGPATRGDTVVDDALRVHGIDGLRVVDASVMPSMPSANTNAATLMIAEKASDMILGRPPLPPAEV
ncbi:MAG: GMC family oxidoreductase [Alphaproteobacteria bacterium]